jgi:hypothetical protein
MDKAWRVHRQSAVNAPAGPSTNLFRIWPMISRDELNRLL